MTAEEFKLEVGRCRTEIEVRRLVHYFWSNVTGTQKEIVEALACADARAEQLASSEEGVGLGVRPADLVAA
jgi:hypothetical protein